MQKRQVQIYIDATPITENRITGIPHFTVETIAALCNFIDEKKLNFRVNLIVPFDKKNQLQRWSFKGARIKSLPFPIRLYNLLWKYNLLPKMDMVMGSGIYLFPNYRNFKLKKSKSYTYIHDLGFIRYPEFVQPKNLEFLKKNISLWINRSDCVLVGSEHTKTEISTLLGCPESKINTIYHGVDHKVFYPRTNAEIIDAKIKYGVKGEYIIAVGSLEPRKNINGLIQAYAQLPENIKSKYGLFLAGGGGWLNDEIHAQIESEQAKGTNIILSDKYIEDDDLPALISGAILLAHTAHYEGFGLPPLQAMACGTPVAVSNSSSLPEVVGKAGALFNPSEPADIAVKIEDIINNDRLREKMIKEGLAQADLFNWSYVAKSLIGLFKADL